MKSSVKRKRSESSNAWLTSLADLMSLMLTFFVLIYSMSEVPKKKWQEVSSSLMEFFKGNKIQVDEDFDFAVAEKVKKDDIRKPFDVTYISSLLDSFVDQQELGVFSYSFNGAELIVSIDYSDLVRFDEKNNQISLTKKGEDIIYNFSNITSPLSNQIEIRASGDSIEKTILISDFIAGKVEEFGYEYTVLRLVSHDLLERQNIKNKGESIEIILRPYESYI